MSAIVPIRRTQAPAGSWFPRCLLPLAAATGLTACDRSIVSPQAEAAPPASASVGAALVEIETSATLSALNDPGTERTNPADVVFRRGMDFEFQSAGDIEGQVRFVVQREIETTAGTFSAASRVIFDPATLNLPGSVLDGRSGAFVGRDIALKVPGIEGGIQTTRFTLHGTGGLAGMKLFGRAVGLEFQGTLVVPANALDQVGSP